VSEVGTLSTVDRGAFDFLVVGKEFEGWSYFSDFAGELRLMGRNFVGRNLLTELEAELYS
jgi:hypothetical protein